MSIESERDEALMENMFSTPESKMTTPGKTLVSRHAGRGPAPRLRTVAPLGADSAKRILAHANAVYFECLTVSGTVRPAAGVVSKPENDVFQLRIQNEYLQFEIERLSELLEVPAEWWVNCPGGLRASLLQDFLAVLLPGGAVQVEHIGFARETAGLQLPAEVAFSLARESHKTKCYGCIRFQSPAAADLLVGAWQQLSPASEPTIPPFLIPVHVEIFSTQLKGEDLARLRRGALVPVGAPFEGKDVLVTVGWGRQFVASGVINQKIVTLQGELTPMEESTAGGPVSLSELSGMENIDVQFTVELATCSLPLSELSRLGAGSTLNLGLPHEPPLVRLCVNGKAVATGELVVLGQSLGVQIVDMASA